MRPGPKPRRDAAQRRTKNVTAAMRRYRKRHRSRINAERNAKNARNKERLKRFAPLPSSQLFVTNALGHQRPGFLWMGPDGAVHHEEWESVEEMCARFLKEANK